MESCYLTPKFDAGFDENQKLFFLALLPSGGCVGSVYVCVRGGALRGAIWLNNLDPLVKGVEGVGLYGAV